VWKPDFPDWAGTVDLDSCRNTPNAHEALTS